MTVQEMMKINEKEKREKREKMISRDAEIAKNLLKLETWKNDIKMRSEKKETVKIHSTLSFLFYFLNFIFSFQDARVAKERKDRLIDEVRRHFGYTIDQRDERFKELLETKEKEQRKALKESKRKEKETKFFSKIAELQPGSKDTPEKKQTSVVDDGEDEKKL